MKYNTKKKESINCISGRGKRKKKNEKKQSMSFVVAEREMFALIVLINLYRAITEPRKCQVLCWQMLWEPDAAYVLRLYREHMMGWGYPGIKKDHEAAKDMLNRVDFRLGDNIRVWMATLSQDPFDPEVILLLSEVVKRL